MAERTVVPKVLYFIIIDKLLFYSNLSYNKDWDDYDEIAQDAIRTGSSCVEGAYMYAYELQWATDLGTQWYRSKDRKDQPINPFMSFLMNKKWTLEEDLNNHILRFQQVIMSSITSIN